MSLKNQIAKEMLSEIPSDRIQNIDIIEEEFKKAGLPLEFAAAAIVNAWHESRLNSDAEGDQTDDVQRCTHSDRLPPCPQSIGLFQLKAPSGAGHGMTVAERKDPRLNTQRIIKEVKSHYGKHMKAAYANGERRVSHFAALFCRDIERPANKDYCWDKRAVTAQKFFPTDRVSPKSVWPWIIGIGAVLGVSYGVWYWRFRK